MAYVVVTSDENYVYVDFGDTWNGKDHKERKGKFKRNHISQILKEQNKDLTGYVLVLFDGANDAWECCVLSEVKPGLFPIESVGGVVTDTLDKLDDELSKLMK